MEKNISKKHIFWKKKFRKKFVKKNFRKKFCEIFFTNIGWSKFEWVEVGREWNFLTTIGWSRVEGINVHLLTKQTGPKYHDYYNKFLVTIIINSQDNYSNIKKGAWEGKGTELVRCGERKWEGSWEEVRKKKRGQPDKTLSISVDLNFELFFRWGGSAN